MNCPREADWWIIGSSIAVGLVRTWMILAVVCILTILLLPAAMMSRHLGVWRLDIISGVFAVGFCFIAQFVATGPTLAVASLLHRCGVCEAPLPLVGAWWGGWVGGFYLAGLAGLTSNRIMPDVATLIGLALATWLLALSGAIGGLRASLRIASDAKWWGVSWGEVVSPPPRRFRVSVRGVLVLMTVTALGSAWIANATDKPMVLISWLGVWLVLQIAGIAVGGLAWPRISRRLLRRWKACETPMAGS